MHYLDNIIPSINRSEYSYKDFASEVQYGSWGQANYRVSNDAVKNALHDLFNYIYHGKINGQERQGEIVIKNIIYSSGTANKIPATFFNRDTGKTTVPKDIDEYFNLFQQHYSGYRYIENLTDKSKFMLGQIVYKFGFKSYEFEFKTRKTAFYANSLAMSSDLLV